MNFVWNMTEENWKNLKHDDAQKRYVNISKDMDFYGNCYVGHLSADIQHTGDEHAWYAFVNVFGLGIDDGYGETNKGKIPYSLLDDSEFEVPMDCNTFDDFKMEFEKNFTDAINSNEQMKELASMPLGNWD